MPFHIITLAFSPDIQGFDDSPVQDFCLNKLVRRIESHFFIRKGQPYWTLLIRYRSLAQPAKAVRTSPDDKKERPEDGLDPTQALLFQRLREWRRAQAEAIGGPTFLVANNEQLVAMIRQQVSTLAGFAPIPGFGAKKTAKYGADIIHIIKTFYEQPPASPKTPTAP
ncbi:MAG: HRDC domain-containing protein [Bacteroidia bacterium]|nr:HRDC domain-containing protein [Bacteroidia bacterium]